LPASSDIVPAGSANNKAGNQILLIWRSLLALAGHISGKRLVSHQMAAATLTLYVFGVFAAFAFIAAVLIGVF
jgi:hypothetical protein